ncbi:APC family permease [Wukongibacter baidiensis]|uniref:APC family permease n=1 Tax=Wukongibacter baidiensis TaxID=1723361 RepID=UPI003D7FEB83
MSKDMELNQSLKPSNVFAIAVGSIIGFACFVLPDDWIKEAGPMGVAIAFALGAIMMIFIGKGYGYMIDKFPVAGGAFAFAYKGFGRIHAYVCGWMLTLGYLSVVSLNATALPILARFIMPSLLTKGYLYSVAGSDIYLGEISISILAILIFAFLNYRGSEIMGKIQFIMVALLFISVVLLAVGAFLKPGASIENLNPLFAPGKTFSASILAVLAIAPMAYVGFDTIPHAAEEFDFSPSMAFKLIVLSVVSGGVIYIVVELSTAMPYPWLELIGSNPVWATGTAMKSSMGNIGVLILVTGVTMGIFTGMNGFYMATSRLLLSMARAKVLPGWFAKVHPVYKTPTNGIIFTMVFALILPLFGRVALLWIVDMCGLGTAISFFYTCFTAYLMVRKNRNERSESIFHLLGSFFSIVFIILLCLPGSPAFMALESWICLILWVIIGFAFYLVKAKEYRSVPKNVLDNLILGIKE